MSDDVRRKLLMKYLGNVDELNDDKSEEKEARDDIKPLKKFSNTEEECNLGGNNDIKNQESLENLPNWKEYFDFNNIYVNKNQNVSINFYYKLPTNCDALSIPIFIFHHGAGSSALTFAALARELFIKLNGKCAIMAFDARGHSQTKPLDQSLPFEFYLDDFCADLVSLLEYFHQSYLQDIPEEKKSYILVGHSLGGSICTFAHSNLPIQIKKQVVGVTMLDIVEEAAILALENVQEFLYKTPNVFKTYREAIRWGVKNGLPRSEESAEISIPALLHKSKTGKVVRISNLKNFSKYWSSWFVNLSHEFVSLPTSKMLILAGNDNLDKELIVGQMQGKYQLVVFQDSGHFIQEDASLKTAITLIDFWKRNDNKTVIIKSNWGTHS